VNIGVKLIERSEAETRAFSSAAIIISCADSNVRWLHLVRQQEENALKSLWWSIIGIFQRKMHFLRAPNEQRNEESFISQVIYMM